MRAPNEIIQDYKYPIPLVDELMAGFTELNFPEVFHQMGMDEQSRDITCFATEKGVFRFTRMNYSTKLVPEKFQQII